MVVGGDDDDQGEGVRVQRMRKRIVMRVQGLAQVSEGVRGLGRLRGHQEKTGSVRSISYEQYSTEHHRGITP